LSIFVRLYKYISDKLWIKSVTAIQILPFEGFSEIKKPTSIVLSGQSIHDFTLTWLKTGGNGLQGIYTLSPEVTMRPHSQSKILFFFPRFQQNIPN
jgi:hypothetical protein